MSDIHDISATFRSIDSSLRRLCNQATVLDTPWSGASGVGLVKRNDIHFPSRAQNTSNSVPGDRSAPRPSQSPGSEDSSTRCRDKIGSVKDDQSQEAWQSWMDQSADLEDLDLDELTPEDVLRQAQELGAVAAKRSAALDKLVGIESSQAEHVSVPLVHSALPHAAVPVQEVDDADLLLTMMQEQAAVPTREEELQRRIDLLRGNPSFGRLAGGSRDTDFQARLEQLRLTQADSPEDANVAVLQWGNIATTLSGQPDTVSILQASASPPQEQTRSTEVSPTQYGVKSLNKDTTAGIAEVDALLAVLRDCGTCLPANDGVPDGTPSAPASSDLDAFEAQQVQQLVERAMLSDDLSVPPEQTGDIDDRVGEQWHEQCDQPTPRSSISSRSYPSQGLIDNFMQGSSQLRQEPNCGGKADDITEGPCTDSGTVEVDGYVEWSAEDIQQPAVNEAADLNGKLQTSLALASDDQRRPRWLAAIAMRSAGHGLKALQGRDLKLANALSKTCLAAAAHVDLQPEEKAKVDIFCLKLHQVRAGRALQLISDANELKIQQSTQNSPVSGFPSPPGPSAGA